MCHQEHQPRNVAWKDLLPVNPAMTLTELAIPLPWLIVSFAFYASPWPVFGVVASFMFFLCALRLNHEAIHNNLGLPRWADHWVMHVLSALMLGANHAQGDGDLACIQFYQLNQYWIQILCRCKISNLLPSHPKCRSWQAHLRCADDWVAGACHRHSSRSTHRASVPGRAFADKRARF